MDRVNETIIASFEVAPIGLQILRMGDLADRGSFYVLAINRAACELLGHDMKADVGKPWRDVSPELANSEFSAMFRDALLEQKPVSWEIEYGDAKFEKNWWRGTATPVDARTLVLVFQNVTQNVTKERQNLLRLERTNRELDDFAYVASHDLRAPLRDIDNLCTWISEDLRDVPPQTATHLQKLRQRVRRMDTLLSDLLEYSRAGRRFAKPEVFRLQDVFDNVRGLLPDDERIVVTFAGGDLELEAPRPPLEVVLRNLVNNAIKHHDRPTGHVTVSARAVDALRLELCVSDDGPGIPEEFHHKVFRMFQTLQPRDKLEASGMGLAVSKKLIESYGEQIVLESGRGRGATFRFTWPRKWNQQESVL